MSTESVASESLPVENVPVVVEGISDETPTETEAVADSTPAPAAGEIPAKKQEGFSKRIDELTRDFYGEKRAREMAERDAQHWRETAEALKPKAVETPTTTPKLEDFAFDEEKYRTAVIEFARTEAARTARQVLTEEQSRLSAQSRAETFATRQTEYLAKNPEYQTKVMENPRLPISAAMRDIIIESPLGPEVAEYLADNPEVATQIYRMTNPALVGKELGRIEAKLERPLAPVVPKVKVSEAPLPPPKLEAKESGGPKDPSDMNFEEFAKWRGRYINRR